MARLPDELEVLKLTSSVTAPAEICSTVGAGKSPETIDAPVSGAVPMTWKKDVDRALPLTVSASSASSAPTETSVGSYAAAAVPKAVAKREPTDDSRNFFGLSFSFAQSGLPAE